MIYEKNVTSWFLKCFAYSCCFLIVCLMFCMCPMTKCFRLMSINEAEAKENQVTFNGFHVSSSVLCMVCCTTIETSSFCVCSRLLLQQYVPFPKLNVIIFCVLLLIYLRISMFLVLV